MLSHCEDIFLYVACTSAPLVTEGVQNLTLAPYNSFYGNQQTHINACGLLPELNLWDQPVCVISKGPRASSFTLLAPDAFYEFAIPFVIPGLTTTNPCPLPPLFAAALKGHLKKFRDLRSRLLFSLDIDDGLKSQISSTVQQQFFQWLADTGNIRAISDLQALESGQGHT